MKLNHRTKRRRNSVSDRVKGIKRGSRSEEYINEYIERVVFAPWFIQGCVSKVFQEWREKRLVDAPPPKPPPYSLHPASASPAFSEPWRWVAAYHLLILCITVMSYHLAGEDSSLDDAGRLLVGPSRNTTSRRRFLLYTSSNWSSFETFYLRIRRRKQWLVSATFDN